MSENEIQVDSRAGDVAQAVMTEAVTQVVTEEVVTEEVVTEAVTEDVVTTDAAAENVPENAAEPKVRRRVKTRSLFVGAIVLGVLGGVGTGYAVQASRPETPLPSLVAAHPSYAPVGVYAGVAPSPLPTGQDDMALTDGDLTKLLVPTPSGASVGGAWDHEWVNLVDDAYLCDDEKACFTTDLMNGIRALADTGWTKSGYYEEIRILRFDPQYETGGFLDGTTGDTILPTPADLNAKAVEYRDRYDENTDYGVASHGDLVVEFWVSSTTRVPDPSVLSALMTQQMARL
jgi:hypothetical protein